MNLHIRITLKKTVRLSRPGIDRPNEPRKMQQQGAHLGAEKHKLVTGRVFRLVAGFGRGVNQPDPATPPWAKRGSGRSQPPPKEGHGDPESRFPAEQLLPIKIGLSPLPVDLHCGQLPAFAASERPAAESPREEDGSCNQEKDPMAA
ncbi:hypothetical protein L209DRAFT_757537 [Thermothelomyces heterothallicus CBS 203.75]